MAMTNAPPSDSPSSGSHSSSSDANDFSADKERCARATMAARTDRVEMEDVSASSNGFLMDVVRMRASGDTFNYTNGNAIIAGEKGRLTDDRDNQPPQQSMPLPLPLRRAPALHRDPSIPGAYRGTPGSGFERMNTVPMSRFTWIWSRNAHLNSPPVAAAAAAAGLVEARLVPELDLQTAIEMDTPSQPVHATRTTSYSKYSRMLLVVAVCAVVAVTLATTVLLVHSRVPPNHDPQDSPNPQDLTTQDYLLQALFQQVPDTTNTLQMLRDPSSPQTQAFQWLLQDPGLLNYDWHRLRQRFALATFFYATHQNNSTWIQDNHWLSYGHHECDWHQTSSRSIFGKMQDLPDNSPCVDQQYTHLWQTSNNLTGTIPPELYWLTSLQFIELSRNYGFGGTISTHIQHLTNLQQLLVRTCRRTQNSISGTLPSQLALLTKLQVLDFGCVGQNLTGTIPLAIFHYLTDLYQLTLDGNRFQGTIPTQIGLLTDLLVLTLVNDGFNGTLPTQIGLLTELKYLYFYQNQLTGPLPTQLGLLSKMEWLRLQDNHFTGNIPTQLRKMTALQEFSLASNQFSGGLTIALGRLSLLRQIDLSHNPLKGDIHWKEWSQLTALQNLTIQDTLLTGPLPSHLGMLSTLQYIDLSGNRFTGTIPTNWSGCGDLKTLHLNNNSLSGTIPTEVAAFTGLVSWNVASNNLSGSLPWQVFAEWLPNITILDVSGNIRLTGIIPKEFCPTIDIAGITTNSQSSALAHVTFDCTDRLCGCGCNCSKI